MYLGLGYKPGTREEAENALLFWELKRKCLEARILQTDPNDDSDGVDGGFGDMVSDIIAARDEVKRLRGILNEMRTRDEVDRLRRILSATRCGEV